MNAAPIPASEVAVWCFAAGVVVGMGASLVVFVAGVALGNL